MIPHEGTICTRANKIRLYPTPEQAQFLVGSMGAQRFVYNWALEHWGRMYARGEKPSGYALAKTFRLERPEWFKSYDAEIVDRATANLQRAFQEFFAKRSKYPVFKKRGERDSYQVKAAKVTVADADLKIPKCKPIRMARPLFRVGEIVSNVTITRQAGRWYASIPVQCEVAEPTGAAPVVGIDVGLRTFATFSDGRTMENPRYLRKAARREALSNRRLSRAKRGSANRLKAKARLARRRATVANRRRAFLHGVTSDIAKTYQAVAIEDLNVKGMVRNHHLAKSISDASFYEFRRQLEYKMPGRVLVVDRFYPSSKLCSACGHARAKLTLKEREWTCESCGAVHDRDVNAAINLVRAFHPESTPAEIGALGAGR